LVDNRNSLLRLEPSVALTLGWGDGGGTAMRARPALVENPEPSAQDLIKVSNRNRECGLLKDTLFVLKRRAFTVFFSSESMAH